MSSPEAPRPLPLHRLSPQAGGEQQTSGKAVRSTPEGSSPDVPVRLGTPRTHLSSADAPHTKLLMVDFRSGETVRTHPGVVTHLEEGWHVQSAAPRVTPEGTRLLVVLTRFPPVG